VYRSLDPDTIVRAGGRWKLADLSQVHEIGRFEPGAVAGHGAPPEAASGIILPAWDIWSLGVLLQDTFGGKDASLPAPYDAIARGCLTPDVEKRLSIHGIRMLLEPRPVSQPLAELPAEAAHPTPRRLIAIVAGALVLTAVVVALLWRPAGRKERTLPAVVTRPVAKPQSAAREVRPSPFTGEVQLTPPVQAPKKSAPLQTLPAGTPAPAKTKAAEAVQKTGRAEYLSDDLNGHRTATGEPFNNHSLTAASRAYPLGSRLRVTNLKNGRSVTVRVNDRGASRHAIISVTRRAAEELGFVRDGSARVRLQLLK
jgi:rare lipoprotein A